MAFLYSDLTEVSPYLKARKKFYTPEAWQKMINALKTSTTLYIGNLSFYTDEEQVYTLFSLCGPVRRVIMGIHKYTHLPCGFCFVEYYFHRDAMAARNYLNGTKLDDRIVRVDLDPGFEPGRQFGRGTTGGQVRDDRRREYDEGRGGLPPRHKQRLEKNAIASGTLIAPTNGPLHNNHQNRHRYERNMSVNQSTNNKEQKEEKKEMSTNNNKKNDDIKVENNSNGNVKNDNENGRMNEENDEDNKDNKKEDMQVDTQVESNGNGSVKDVKTDEQVVEVVGKTETVIETETETETKTETMIKTVSDIKKDIESNKETKPPALDHITEPAAKKQRLE